MRKNRRFTRRGFLKGATAVGLGAISLPTVKVINGVAKTNPIQVTGTGLDLAVARNGSPAQNTEAVIKALGGMDRFVKPGDVVVFKPNCVVAQAPPKWAVNTNPDVIGMIVRLCKQAGAKEVIAVTHNVPKYFRRSGIGDAIVKLDR